jgi:hypothetical protein
MKMRALLLAVLLPTSALAANSFPPCNGTFINEVWQAQDGTFWYCNGANWIGINATLDGGAVGSDLTVYGDAGIAGALSVGKASTLSTTNVLANAGIDGGLIVSGTLGVVGASTLSTTNVVANLGVDGGALVFGTLGVTSASTLSGVSVISSLGVDGGVTVTGDAGFYRVAASTDIEVAGQLVPTQHSATQAALEFGSDAGTNGALTVAFATAFAAPPACFCQHVNTTNTSPCNLNSASLPAVGTASFMVDAGGTDRIVWFCMGSK